MIKAAALCTAAVLLLAGAVPAAGQAQEPVVSRLIPDLVNISAVITKGETGDHTQHFVPGLSSAGVIYELNRAIALQASGFPLGPTSAVVSSRGQAGASEPRLFGAGYTDTAFSLGSGRLLFSIAYQTTTFEKFDDIGLRSSEMNLYIPHAPATGDVSDRDMMRQVLSFRLNRKVVSFTFGYGWRDRFDVGVVVPIEQIAAEARVTSYIVRTASEQTPAVHEFDIIDRANRTFPRACSPIAQLEIIDPKELECHGSSTARGIGDIMARGKVRLFGGASALALAVDLRLPTGNSDEWLGLGATQVTPALVWSLDAGRIGARARADYTWSNGDLSSRLAEGADGLDLSVPDEIGLGFGLDADIARRTTLALDIMGRRIPDMPRITSGQAVFPSRGPGPLPSASFVVDDALLFGGNRDLTQVMAALGLRFDIPGGVMAQVSALVPVSSDGLQPQSMAVFSLTKRY